ncbi:MAG: Hsp20/alpha crystallin family protein [Candidatus Diapherotrites archaeon]|nr:Hsp20/alpha crystallin family protein [Candidatus Diapherotrites archaeon]
MGEDDKKTTKKSFDILGEFDRIDEMMEKMVQNMIKDIELGGSSEPYVYGFSMKVGPDGKPTVDEFGNIVKGAGGELEHSGEREPLTFVNEDHQHIIVTVELPGCSKEEIVVSINGKDMEITAENGDKHFRKVLKLPCEVIEKTSKAKYNNGILEVTMEKGEKDIEKRKISVE